MAVKRLTTRGYATAEAIKNLEPFVTSGSLKAVTSSEGDGLLNLTERRQFVADLPDIDYIVYSYDTPIAWHLTNGLWHKVAQKFSRTTTKHMGNLYLV